MPKPSLDEEWKGRVRGFIKAEIARRNIKYKGLVLIMEDKYGVKKSPQNLSIKIARGTFTAISIFQILEAIGSERIEISG